MQETIHYSVRDGVAHIVIDDPETSNALSDESLRLLKEVFFRLDDDESAQVAILSAAGSVFSERRDADQRAGVGGGARTALLDSLFQDFARWKPIIAAVHGHVFGTGLHLALMSEMLVAAEGTEFQIEEIQEGRDGGLYWSLISQRARGAFATDVGITGRVWTAEEGLRVRAVDRVAPLGKQVEVAEELARTLIMKNPPLAARAIVEARRGALAEITLHAKLTRQKASLSR